MMKKIFHHKAMISLTCCSQSFCNLLILPSTRYTVMSGTPSKMLEHLLDTRLNVQVGPNDDPFLDDFLLTHIVFMPIAQLVDELASHYHNDSEIRNGAESPEDYEYLLTCKKRVVHFIQRWVMAVRHAVFEDSAAAHFIEVRTFLFVEVVRAKCSPL